MLLGQSIDLHTTYVVACPREDEYLNMVDNSSSSTHNCCIGIDTASRNRGAFPYGL